MKLYFIGLMICGAALAGTPGPSGPPSKTEEYLNPGEPIKVESGRIFAIRMASNPTTGYGWQLAGALDRKITLVTNVFVPPAGKLLGAGGHEVWSFKAAGEGRAEICMQYVRPWETNQPARTNFFTVIVKRGPN